MHSRHKYNLQLTFFLVYIKNTYALNILAIQIHLKFKLPSKFLENLKLIIPFFFAQVVAHYRGGVVRAERQRLAAVAAVAVVAAET